MFSVWVWMENVARVEVVLVQQFYARIHNSEVK